jgi:hypothetical protein
LLKFTISVDIALAAILALAAPRLAADTIAVTSLSLQ